MFSGYYQPQDNIASVIPCSPEMSIRTTTADGLLIIYQANFLAKSKATVNRYTHDESLNKPNIIKDTAVSG